ncbi:Phosphonate ABC transporter phosphate-binding periplasmic component [Candidatus Rhodobacter oscarellae]|uniref:Phosphonate ABC transporter phosphate-binding periplasmic component n=1 Tax=Candidatus Rhodobacter oscarellae TaxID=1675527 RepID=A0A0J9E978_9RHOB|nr:phosphate/phosphite/phosphonate ABC transporter substrate-binding protein [Candidatus Rhodobacter lobularis]KMW59181.1 Phosphonate ABC transporter phosphate-binding periplasmic component [Candidatus Rhodobacter lobularis]
MMRRLAQTVAAMALAIAGTTTAHAQSGGTTLTFGIVPQQSASRLAKMWGPFLSELSARTGVTVQFKTTKDIPTFEACLAEGAYDIAYMNPMHYAIFSEESGYRAFARQSQKRLKGVIVARAEGPVQALGDLDGTQVAFPSPGAFGASILTRSTLSERGIAFTPNYVKSHDSVYRAVAAGLMAAGGGVTRTFNAVDPAIRAQLRIMHETEAYTPHAFAASRELPEALADAVRQAFLDIAADQPALVDGIGMNGFTLSGDSDWDDVRGLGMARADTGIATGGGAACPSG